MSTGSKPNRLAARDERLRAALRENLRRRKAQRLGRAGASERSAAGEASAVSEPPAGDGPRLEKDETPSLDR